MIFIGCFSIHLNDLGIVSRATLSETFLIHLPPCRRIVSEWGLIFVLVKCSSILVLQHQLNLISYRGLLFVPLKNMKVKLMIKELPFLDLAVHLRPVSATEHLFFRSCSLVHPLPACDVMLLLALLCYWQENVRGA